MENIETETHLILAEDVEILSINNIDKKYIDGLDYNADDYIILKTDSRYKSKLIPKDVAVFLNYFNDAKSINDAIIDYCSLYDEAPLNFLDKIYPAIRKLVASKFLIDVKMLVKSKKEIFSKGDIINEIKIIENIQLLEDIDVYKGITKNCLYVALKIGQDKLSNPITEKNLLNEEKILNKANNIPQIVKLSEFGLYKNRPYIMTEWIDGDKLNYCAKNLYRSFDKIYDICLSILNVYCYLHELNILHVDINPRNILIKNNTAYLIDFSLSIDLDHVENNDYFKDLGSDYYTSPEEAIAKMNQNSVIPDFRIEQYKIGVLLYLILTGSFYLNFKKDRDSVLEQISISKPNTFAQSGLFGFQEIEKVLLKTLSKDPDARYTNTREFYDAFNEALIKDKITFNEKYSNNYRKQSIDSIISYFEPNKKAIKNYLTEISPYCSLSYGASGIAYFFYKLSIIYNDPKYLSYADIWNNLALNNLNSKEAFLNEKLGLTSDKIPETSLFYSLNGVYFIQAIINMANGDYTGLKIYLEKWINTIEYNINNFDLMFGMSGILLGCAFLHKNTYENILYSKNDLIKVATNIRSVLINFLDDDFARSSSERKIKYNGIAHGLAGIIYAIIQWDLAIGANLDKKLEFHFNELLNRAERINEGICWRIKQNKSGEFATGWCNGTAGYIFLITQMFQLTKKEEYLEKAVICGTSIIRQEIISSDLCCGLSGSGYALLNLYKIDQNNIWLDKSLEYCSKALDRIHYNSLKFSSLFKGIPGVALFAIELDLPMKASFPIFG